MKNRFDLIIIGGGVVGSAIAREASRYALSIAVLEKNLDVCYETSGRNTGVIHGGFAYTTGTLKARFCVEGNQMMDTLSSELGFDFKRTGKVLVGNTEEERESLMKTKAQGERNGVKGLTMIDRKRLKELVPTVEGAFALYSKNSGIVNPFQYTIALAENAAHNGVTYFLDHEVKAAAYNGKEWIITAGNEEFRASWVVNAAGLGCKKISDMLGFPPYRVIGSKDDYILLDNRLGSLVPMPIYTVPSNTYMGVHVSCTTDGNVLIGPTAEDTDNFCDYGTEQKNIDALAKSGKALWPHFTKNDYIRTYRGILPKWVDDNGVIQDFKIEIKDALVPHAVNLFGIESPGLTSAVPIARYVLSLIKERIPLQANTAFNPIRKALPRFATLSNEEKAALIAKDPNWGELICRCQKVSKAEIIAAIHNPLGVSTMTGIKYRTHAMMGRCQGGYCQMRIASLIESELGYKCTDVLYNRKGSELFTGCVREAE